LPSGNGTRTHLWRKGLSISPYSSGCVSRPPSDWVCWPFSSDFEYFLSFLP
jgi:hypothetical protein